MKFIISSCVLLAIIGSSLADTPAQEQCRQIHHVDADAAGTQYVNNNCRLDCNIHGKIYSTNLNEGYPCVAGRQDYICRQGQCVNSSPSYGLGHIDIELISASLYNRANAYATVCLKNDSAPVNLPLSDRRGCTECSSHVKQNTNYPQWNEVCSGSSNFLFRQDSRVTIEVWDYHGTNNKQFLGGSTLTIDQMLRNNDNHRQLNLALINGQNPGQVSTRITWTPRN